MIVCRIMPYFVFFQWNGRNHVKVNRWLDRMEWEWQQWTCEVGISSLRDQGQKHWPPGWLETLKDMTENDEQWGSCCRYLSKKADKMKFFRAVRLHIPSFGHWDVVSSSHPCVYPPHSTAACNSMRSSVVNGLALLFNADQWRWWWWCAKLGAVNIHRWWFARVEYYELSITFWWYCGLRYCMEEHLRFMLISWLFKVLLP